MFPRCFQDGSKEAQDGSKMRSKSKNADFQMFFDVFKKNGHFGKYSNKPSRAGGGVLGEGERIYPLRLYAWSSILFIL